MKRLILILFILNISNVFAQNDLNEFQQNLERLSISQNLFQQQLSKYKAHLRGNTRTSNIKSLKNNLKRTSAVYGQSLVDLIKGSYLCMNQTANESCGENIETLRRLALHQYNFMKDICYVGPVKVFSKYSKIAKEEKKECLNMVSKLRESRVASNVTVAYLETELCDLLEDSVRYSKEDNLKIRYLVCQ